jgi:PTS system ascorbate-specific IIA component
MAVGILVVTHGRIGEELLASAGRILGGRPLPCASFSVEQNCDPERVVRDVGNRLAKLDEGDGVLVLVDLFGATPCNVVCRLPDAHPCAIVTGVSLPMLIKVFNYPALDLAALSEKAREGGHEGVMRVADVEY